MELHIEYSQNGRTISDELFLAGSPGTGFDSAEISAAKQAAWSLVDEMGCGTAAVYVKTDVSRSYISIDMTSTYVMSRESAHNCLWNALAHLARSRREPWQVKEYTDVHAILEPIRWELARELRANRVAYDAGNHNGMHCEWTAFGDAAKA